MLVVYILIGIIALALILALFIPRDMDYEKSIEIDAPVNHVWEHVSMHRSMDEWNPWKEKDPDMDSIIEGEDGTVGAKSSWKSKHKEVGEGSQTFTKMEKPNFVETRLEFLKPFKSTATGYVNLQEKGNKTIAIWGFKSQLPYPMNLMKLFMNFEKQMEKEFGKGLKKLKAISEKT